MNRTKIYPALTYFFATVWFINGFFCKVLNQVPRHQEIVARIMGNGHAHILTQMIGVSEILMAIWILSGIKPRFNAIMQMMIVGTMNAIEFTLACDLLFWGKLNALFAALFITLIYYNEFVLRQNPTSQL